MPALFADTYALVAYADGSRPYKVLSGVDYVTTGLNAAEFAHVVLRRGGGGALDQALAPILQRVVEPARDVPRAAAEFKLERLRAGGKCSFVDAWGYATARSLGIPFLTGDEDFRGVPGVQFLKA